MKISERKLRSVIRNILQEQVVGYQAPSKSYDDPMSKDEDPLSAHTDTAGDGSSGYMQIGDVSVPTSVSDTASAKTAGAHMSPQDKQQIRSQMSNLSRKRQTASNMGDAKKADYLGIQMKRLKDILNP